MSLTTRCGAEFFGTFWLVVGGCGSAGIAIGLSLTLIHLLGIPVDNLSVNPARSTGPALFRTHAEKGAAAVVAAES